MSNWVSNVLRMSNRDESTPHRAALLSRSSIWIDGERARLLDASARPLVTAALAKTGDVPALLVALNSVMPPTRQPGLHFVRVLVGAPFVRYFALPWRPLPKPIDWVSLARAQFVREGPGGSDTWRFAVPDSPWSSGRLAVAMPDPLCVEVARLCKVHRLQLSGIEPGFTHALARNGKRIQDGAIVVIALEEVEAGFAIAHIGFRSQRQWVGFVSLPASGSVADVLRDAITLCAVPPPDRTYVMSPVALRKWVAESPATQWLPTPWDAAP